MPARPPAGNPQRSPAVAAGPGIHFRPFLHYLEAECGMAANTLAAYGSDLEQFLAWYAEHGPARVRDVDLALLTKYVGRLHHRGLAASTIARHIVSIRTFFKYLVLEGVLAESIAELLDSPRLWERLPKVLGPEMVERLLDAPTAADRFPLRDRAILCTLYATGCRVSEVTGLRLRDVHLDESYCRCVGKGNKERLVSLNPRARLALEAYLEHERPLLAAGHDEGWLFVSKTGRSLSRISVWGLIKKYAARAGCSATVSPHTLRHSFATHMLAGGAEIRALQELLGHASIRTTQLYTHVEHSRLKAVHKKHHPRG
ncbi:MAG: site-specific tyrosine recombinase XerD [Planctomycetales bacterium]